MSASTIKWAKDLAAWGIPSHILEQAPQDPWIHPPVLFTVPREIPSTVSHDLARQALVGGGSILDIGCGGGIAAFAAVPPATHVIGVDHQQEMLEMFAAEAEIRSVTHQEFLGYWPKIVEQVPSADVVTCHHVAYNVSDIEPFLKALDAHSNRRVVIEIPQKHPLSVMSEAWKYFWNLERPTSPNSNDLLNIVRELGFDAQMSNWMSSLGREIEFDQEVEFMRIRLCLPATRDNEIAEFLEQYPRSLPRSVSTIWWDK